MEGFGTLPMMALSRLGTSHISTSLRVSFEDNIFDEIRRIYGRIRATFGSY